MFRQYFEEEKHPAALDTLLAAAKDAEIDEADAKAFINAESEYLQATKTLIREQTSNGIDTVPYIIFEGKKRDITLMGAKDIEEYLKEMETVAKESK